MSGNGSAAQLTPPSSGTKATGPSTCRSIFCSALDQPHELLLPFRPDRHDQPPADGELLEQRLRNPQRRGSDQDAVEGRVRGPADVAVAVAEADVLDAEFLQPFLRALQQRLDALDRVDASSTSDDSTAVW